MNSTNTDAPPLVAIADARFSWRADRAVLDIPAFTLAQGEKVFLRGPSGGGKSTLLGLICGVLVADAGRVSVMGRDMAALGPAGRDAMRADRIGVIFQMFNLVPYLSMLGNVALACRFSAARRARATQAAGSVEAEAARLLGRLGLGDPERHAASVRDLSVGQQQRVAVARALIGRPDLIIADEPTSALDADARDAFLALLIEEADAAGAGLLLVSHDPALATRFDRAVDLSALNRVASSEAAR